MRLPLFPLLLALAAALSTPPLHAAYLLEVDIDGADDGALTYHPGFSFGGDTTTASQSGASGAVGMTGGDGIFGGDGSALPDTYRYTYAPDSESDNLLLSAGTPLGEANYASGAVGGLPGTYAVYATWTRTANVDGGLTTYLVETAGDSFSVSLDQNGPGGYGSLDLYGGIWVKLGEIEYSSGPVTVTQTPETNGFVSMRAAGMLFELVSAPPPPPYDGPPGPVILGQGLERYLGIAFERDRTEAQGVLHSVLRSTDLLNWATTDLKLVSVTARDASSDLVVFRSMAPMAGQKQEFLAVEKIPRMAALFPYVAMTFDDGPHPYRTADLLDLLKERNIRVTFFVTGINAQWHPHLIRRMINEGHQVENHSMTHPDLTGLTEPEVIAELQGCHDAIVAACNVAPTAIRPPYGAVNQSLRDLFLAQFGYPTVLWDVDPRDWDMQVPERQVINSILNGAEHEAIILCHDIHQRTIDIMPEVLDTLLDDGFSFVTIEELYELQLP